VVKVVRPIDIIEADDASIGYSPAVKTKGAKAPRLMTLDFHTTEGWVRVKLEGDVCDTFVEQYAEQFGVGS